MKPLKTLILLLITTKIIAQNPYAAATIPEELKANAHAVLRDYHQEFIVKNAGEAIMRIRGVVTILDEKGLDHASLVLFYNKFTKINDIEAQLYDAKGDRVKRLKRTDIESYSTSSGNNSIDDSHVKVASLIHSEYPFTVAYSIEYTEKNLMFYPTWEAIPNFAEHYAVEKNTFTISMPSSLKLRYQEQKMSTSVSKSEVETSTVYQWQVTNLKAVEAEPNAPPLSSVLPCVYTAPSAFQVEDYAGNCNSWNDLGLFYSTLNLKRDFIPAKAREKVVEIGNKKVSTKEKVRLLYNHLQNSTRYVSIQLGIGGWQTMTAEEVATKGYGDCKALSNYMYAMLKDVGIKSYPVLVRAGDEEEDINTHFPSFQFNHVFLCVPVEKDTVWLECTSQRNPFGYLSDFTSDRHGLLVTETGGKLIKMPTYQATDNQQIRVAKVNFEETGDANISIKTTYTGLQQDSPSGIKHELDAEAQKNYLHKSLPLQSIEIQQFAFKEVPDNWPKLEENITLNSRNICSKSGTRLFLTANVMNSSGAAPLSNPNRKYDVSLSMNYVDVDSISFNIPQGYRVEFLPEGSQIDTKFGKYSITFKQIDDRILYVRRAESNKNTFPAADYNAWVDYRKKVSKADRIQIVFVKQ